LHRRHSPRPQHDDVTHRASSSPVDTIIKGAIGEIRDRLPGMMTLISLAFSVAFVFSLAVTFGFPGSDLWWELATLVTIMVLGHWIEMRSISQAQGAVKELAKLLPDTASGRKSKPVADCGRNADVKA
jgi:cation transport ATPase